MLTPPRFNSKFFEHFVQISHAMNTTGGTGLWNEEDGFYYDQIQVKGSKPQSLKGEYSTENREHNLRKGSR